MTAKNLSMLLYTEVAAIKLFANLNHQNAWRGSYDFADMQISNMQILVNHDQLKVPQALLKSFVEH